jgi:hypothetical protein
VSHTDDRIPESVREYFGHDKVAHRGSGGLPAAPPAPPGSTARAAGQNAVADGLAKARTPGRRPGDHPAVVPPRPALPRRMRAGGERALMQASMRRLGPRIGAPAPHRTAGLFWRAVFAPVYTRIPWAVRKRMVALASGVKGWRTRG